MEKPLVAGWKSGHLDAKFGQEHCCGGKRNFRLLVPPCTLLLTS